MQCFIQLVNTLFAVIIFEKFHIRELVAGLLCKGFDLFLDELDEFAMKLLQITTWHGKPLSSEAAHPLR